MFSEIISSWLIWFLVGICFALLELAIPGIILIFFGLGALITAASFLLFEPNLTQQIAIFLVSSLILLIAFRKWIARVFKGALDKSGKKGFDDFPGGVRVKVTQDISPSQHGRIHYRGTQWYATADQTIEAGATVEIVDYADQSHQVFYVKPLSS